VDLEAKGYNLWEIFELQEISVSGFGLRGMAEKGARLQWSVKWLMKV